MSTIAYFLKIDGIDGDSTDPAYPHAFIVYSHAFTLQQVGNESGKRFSGLTITKPLGRGTAVLLTEWPRGVAAFTEVRLHGVRKDKTDFEFETIALHEAFLVSFVEDETSGIPTITMTFTHPPNSRIDYAYTPQLPDGTAGTPQTVTFTAS